VGAWPSPRGETASAARFRPDEPLRGGGPWRTARARSRTPPVSPLFYQVRDQASANSYNDNPAPVRGCRCPQ